MTSRACAGTARHLVLAEAVAVPVFVACWFLRGMRAASIRLNLSALTRRRFEPGGRCWLTTSHAVVTLDRGS